MANSISLAERVESAIQVDEVGIETGRYGAYFLKTMYRPVLQPREGSLVPAGIEGLTQPMLDGRPVALRTFWADVAPADRLFVEWQCRLLHVRNYLNTWEDGLTLFVRHHRRLQRDAEAALEQVGMMAAALRDMDVDPGLVVCEIGEGLDGAVLKELADELRRHGMRVAAGDFGGAQSTLSRLRLLEPDVVRIDGGWFRRIAEVAVAARLLSALVEALQGEGRKVLIEGVDTAFGLRLALDTRAALLQGDFLRTPVLAGAIFPMEPVEVEGLLGADEKVVPLFARRDRTA